MIQVKNREFLVIVFDGMWNVTSDEDIKIFYIRGGECAHIVNPISIRWRKGVRKMLTVLL